MQTTLEAIPVSSDDLPARSNQALNHIPGPKGDWFTGNAKALLPNPGPFVRAQRAQYGDCFTFGLFRNHRAVMLVGPEANETVLLDKHNNFSSRMGWEVLLELFGRNVLVRDFADHRQHRRFMTHVFKPDALAHYLNQMNPIITTALSSYEGEVDVYAETKKMALDIAVRVFAGINASVDIESWNQDLNTVLSNAMAHRIRFPGTRYYKGLRARDRLRNRLSEEISGRRETCDQDLFSQLVNQVNDDGAKLSDTDVIDHMFGMLFGAHDTTASSLAMIFTLLSHYPKWQTELRSECEALYRRTGSTHLSYQDIEDLPTVDWVFKEALRLYSPLQLIPRRSVRSFDFQGLTIPENTAIYLVPQATHFDSRHFPNPEKFDPTRFAPDSEKPASFSFIPFGRGSHMCLGMHFAYMEVRAVLYQLLLSRNLEPTQPVMPDLEYLPIVRPTKQMNVRFSQIA